MVVTRQLLATLIAVGFLLTSALLHAAVLPEDRADVLYHRYEGGGITIDGPSVLVRKEFKDKISVWGNVYTDNISGASIDLLSRGSTYYEEHREEKSIGMDYLHDRTVMSLSHTNSSERDYEANSFAFGLSQDFFGDMSTLSLNYSQGNDEVRENIYIGGEIDHTEDRGKAKHQRFGIGLTQVLTRKLMIALNAESIVDEGFLNNPYREVRYVNSSGGASYQKEVYPTTRNSDAFAIRGIYYLPYRAAIRLEYRTYLDSWQINASNYEFRYIHPIADRWNFEFKYRAYEQTQAEFYSDLFPYENAQTFLARDKELSENSNTAYGIGITYNLKNTLMSWVDKATVNFYWDKMAFDYKNFRENTKVNTDDYGLGNEPLYKFDANVVRLFLSINY